MERDELKSLIEHGENDHIEFKSWENARSKKDLMASIAKETVSFANTNGGKIFIGVEDNGDITGCTRYNSQDILSSIYDRTQPHIFTTIDEIEIDGKTVLVINVEKSQEMHSTSSGEVLKRLGKDNRPVSPNQYHSIQISKTGMDYSGYIIEESSENDINPLEVYKLKEKIKARDTESTLLSLSDNALLKDLGLSKIINGKLKLTIAGLLFVGKDEAIRQYLPQSEVIYLNYKNSTDVEYYKRLDLRTTIISTLDRLTQLIEDANTIVNIQVGLFRMEIKDFPVNVFQESLLNAISHRNYISNGAIMVRHYPDRLVIENPGGFPEGINKENIITHPPIARNKLIAETLQRIKYVQRAGQGVDIIFRDMLAFGKQLPSYTIYEDAVKLTLWDTLVSKSFVYFIAQEQEKNQRLFNTSEIILFYYLKDNKEIGLIKASEVTQMDEDETRNILNGMIDGGYIERSGRNYILSHKVYSVLGKDTGYIKDRAVDYIKAKRMVLEYIEKTGFITNSICQELCGYDESKAKYTLKKIKDEGLVNIIGGRKSSKYIRAK